MKRAKVQPHSDRKFIQASPARWTEKRCVGKGQDRLGGAKARDFSRLPHSPSIQHLHGGTPCPA